MALGVTSATVSRVERGLQEPSPQLLEAWQQLLTGQRWLPLTPKSPRRRPRGALNLLAELFLADVKAGLDEAAAGWREPVEVGLTEADVVELYRDLERDSLGRVRIAATASLEPLEQAKRILEYKATVKVEENSLLPIMEARVPLLWKALKDEKALGAILLSGLAKMVRTTTLLILDVCLELISDDPSYLLLAPAGPALVALDSVGIAVPAVPSDILTEMALKELIERPESGDGVLRARRLAHDLEVPTLAKRLGKSGVMAVGAAWAYLRLLDSSKGVVLTEVGQQHVADAFWEGTGFPRHQIVESWNRFIEIDANNDRMRVGSLLWAWPEVL